MKTQILQPQITVPSQDMLVLLGVSELDYHWYIYDKGIEFIHKTAKSKASIDMLQREKMFWDWWKYEWNFRNYSQLQNLQHITDCKLRRAAHNMYHNDLLYVRTQLIDLSYELMITDLLPKLRRKP